MWTKGNWYYETQILMFVIMWRYTEVPPNDKRKENSLSIGRLYIWTDSAWMYHDPVGKFIFNYITDPIGKKIRPIYIFWHSLFAYLRLNRAGFHISSSRTALVRINRFYWKNKQVRDIADIDYHSDGDFHVTVLNGCVRRLK